MPAPNLPPSAASSSAPSSSAASSGAATPSSPAKARILRLHFRESDKHKGQRLHEAILATCRELKIAGATVLRGLEGYGDDAEIHNQPIEVVIVDSLENIDRVKPVLEEMIPTGTVAVSDAEMIRVQRSG
jgi:PII-like signaling protein